MQLAGLVIHVVAFAIWLGASLSFMVVGPLSRGLSLEGWAACWQALARVQRYLVAPFCAITTLTGIVIIMARVNEGMTGGLLMMVVSGLLAAVLTLAFATPLVNRLERLALRSLERQQIDPQFEKVRKLLAVLGSIAGVMILLAAYFGLRRY
jgi:hypothetical protein